MIIVKKEGNIHRNHYEIRNACVSDAEALITYLKVTSEESKYLLREREEIHITLEREEAYLKQMEKSEKEVMLVIQVDGELAGTGSITMVAPYQRYAHRCQIAIALLKKYWGQGYGSLLFQELLTVAEQLQYEQVELQVVSDNKVAIHLYQKMGFEICGTISNAMKYKDGSYADEYVMLKKQKK